MKNISGVDLHEHTKHILLLCQCFGLLPVSGLFSGDLQFKQNTYKVWYSFIILAAHFFMAGMSVIDLLFNEMTFRACNVLMIYVPGFLIHWQFIKLGQNWPQFIGIWKKLEETFKCDCYKEQSKKKTSSFSRLTVLTSLGILLITICEYTFSVGSEYETMLRKNEENPMQAMIEDSFSFITDYVKYSSVLSFCLLAINFFCMFTWNFMDLLIIIICNALVNKFELIHAKVIKSTKDELENEYYWHKIRQDYNQIAMLLNYVNEKLSGIVLLSFSSNVYYILVQLFKSLRFPRESKLENIYLFVSFGMLLLRTSAVSILAAKVNDASKAPLSYLTLLPSEFYCPDLERLINQISLNNIAITGYELFKITRGFLFKIAGTIVTYELFFFQFNSSISFINAMK